MYRRHSSSILPSRNYSLVYCSQVYRSSRTRLTCRQQTLQYCLFRESKALQSRCLHRDSTGRSCSRKFTLVAQLLVQQVSAHQQQLPAPLSPQSQGRKHTTRQISPSSSSNPSSNSRNRRSYRSRSRVHLRAW